MQNWLEFTTFFFVFSVSSLLAFLLFITVNYSNFVLNFNIYVFIYLNDAFSCSDSVTSNYKLISDCKLGVHGSGRQFEILSISALPGGTE
jgi:uncharacterized membrane protein